MRLVGCKMYDVCAACGDIIRINKPIFGALHQCVEGDQYRSAQHPEIKRRYEVNKKALEEMK